MVKKLSCVSCGSLKCFPHTFTMGRQYSVMLFLDLKETSTDMAADWIFEKFKLI